MTKRIATVDRTKELLEQLQVRPLKRLGQNFLIQPDVAEAIVNQYPIQPTDFIIEIGPGLGALTEILCEKSQQVLAIEYDHGLAAHLKTTIRSDNLSVIDSDVLKIQHLPSPFHQQSVIVYSNVPYYITTDVALHVLTSWDVKMKAMILLVQKEVAQKWVKTNLMEEQTASECILRGLCDIRLAMHVSHYAFYPKPEVHSAVAVFTPKVASISDYQSTIQLIQLAYATKRKTVVATLVNAGYSKDIIIEALQRMELDDKVRPTDIQFDQWHIFAAFLKEKHEKK